MKQRIYKTPRVLIKQFFVYYLLTLLPVLFLCYVTCHYEHAESLLPLFFVEWTLVVAVFFSLCPWLGKKGVLFATVVFLLSFCVSAIVVRESIVTYGAIWIGLDDLDYLNQAANVVHSLHHSGWDLYETWTELVSIGSGAWTLSGWPFLLGLVSSFVTSTAPLELLHAVALSLNATFLTIVMALVYYILNQRSRRSPRMVLFCFILLIGDPVIYTGRCLKESLLQLVLMLAFVVCWKLPDRKRVLWGIVFGFSAFGIATTRVAYVPLILAVLYWRALERIRIGPTLRVVLGIVILALSARFLLQYEIRNVEVATFLKGTLEAETGLALSVYKIPLVGRLLYYLIVPVPSFPWQIFASTSFVTMMIRSIGSVAWFFATCYVLYGITRNRKLLKDGLFFAASFMFLGLFIAGALSGADWRYKQSTNFYLAMMLFITWYDSRKLRQAMGVPKGPYAV